jgi:hypothetical protein
MSAVRGTVTRLCRVASTAAFVASLATPALAQNAPPPPAPTTPAPTTPSPTTPAPTTPVPAPAAPAPVETAPAVPPAAAPAPAQPLPGESEPLPAPSAEAGAADEQILRDIADTAVSDEYKLDIYGFADFTYSQILDKSVYFAAPYNSFAVGRLNVYLASELGDNWRSLAEVRFTYLPHGVTVLDSTGTATRTDTTVSDYSDIGRPLRWGGIVIERAWLEYTAHPLLTVRAGHWLTPYGIWNVDHGSPVIIGVTRPYIVGDSLFPQSQTGLELYGMHNFPGFEVGYHLTLSNGRGPVDTYQDFNNNKAFGGRLFGHADTPAGSFTLGASVYQGRYSDRVQTLVVDPSGGFVFEYPLTSDYDEVSWAADFKWESGGFLLQSEAILNQIRYGEPRPTLPNFPGSTPGFMPDTQRLGVYGLMGYRFDFLGTMPFVEMEYYDSGPNSLGKTADFIAGLNVRPTARVVLKGQWTYAWFPGPPIPEGSHYSVLNFQAAWGF